MTTDDIERQQRRRLHVEFALRELTANLMRGILRLPPHGQWRRCPSLARTGHSRCVADPRRAADGPELQEVAGDAEMLHGVRELETILTQARQTRGQRPHGR